MRRVPALLAIVLSCGVLPAAAKVIYVRASGPGTGDGTSWAMAFPDLNDALAAATDEGSAAARAALDACAQGRYTPAPLDASAQEDLRRRAALAVKLMAGAA